jgi:hypothetical protein
MKLAENSKSGEKVGYLFLSGYLKRSVYTAEQASSKECDAAEAAGLTRTSRLEHIWDCWSRIAAAVSKCFIRQSTEP